MNINLGLTGGNRDGDNMMGWMGMGTVIVGMGWRLR